MNNGLSFHGAGGGGRTHMFSEERGILSPAATVHNRQDPTKSPQKPTTDTETAGETADLDRRRLRTNLRTNDHARVTWTHHDRRSYISAQTGKWIAFVFGASRPVDLWAWAVFWTNGKASGVERGFRKAKCEAEKAIRQAEESA